MTIPRIIHQTFRTQRLPTEVALHNRRLIDMNPGWEYRFYDNSDAEAFIRSEFDPDYLAAYKGINPLYGAARADLFRYLLMYKVGGVYLDIKSTARRPLDDVLLTTDQYVLAHWPSWTPGPFYGWGMHRELRRFTGLRGEFQNWHVIAEPLHPFLRETIDRVMHNIATYDPDQSGAGRVAVWRTTGPIAYTKAIVPLLETTAHRILGSHQDLGLQYSIFEHRSPEAHMDILGTDYGAVTAPLCPPG